MAEWKKVIVSGSQAELNSLDLKGSLGNLVVEGNSTFGNASSDTFQATGSANFKIEDKKFSVKNVGDSLTLLELDGDTQTVSIDPTAVGAQVNIGTSTAIGNAQISLGADVATNNKVQIGVGRNNTDVGLSVTGSTDISGSLRVDGTLTVTGDTLQEDLRTTGITRLGNDMDDKTEITGSLHVTGSTNLTGEFTGVADSKYSFGFKSITRNIEFDRGQLKISGQASGFTFLQLRNESNQLLGEINNDNGGGTILLKDTGTNKIQFNPGGNGSFHDTNMHIGGTAVQTDAKLKVTGDAKITSGLQITGSSNPGIALTGSFELVKQNAASDGFEIKMGSFADIGLSGGFGNPHKRGGIKIHQSSGNDTDPAFWIFNNSNQGVVQLGTLGSGVNGQLKLQSGATAHVLLRAGGNGNYINDNLAVGNNSVDSNNTLSVTGNIKATTGITGSYLTNNNILVAGSAGEVESSGVTWDGSTLDLGAGNITSTGDLTIADARINGDLTVAGTASFENTENLKVTDRFISLASGSTSAGDGGIVIQQAASGLGEVFGFDEANGGRWGLRSSFDPTASLFTPTDFMVTTTKNTSDPSADPTYGGATGHGNMHVNTSTGDIFIYA